LGDLQDGVCSSRHRKLCIKALAAERRNHSRMAIS
jgi:hypothetical protein